VPPVPKTTPTNVPTTTANNPQPELLPLVHLHNIFDALDDNNNKTTLTNIPTTAANNPQLELLPPVHPLKHI